VKIEEHTGSPVNLMVEIHEDKDGNNRYVFGTDASGRAAAGRFSGREEEKKWRKIVIPFYQFRGVHHRNRLIELAFVVEIKKGSSQGRILIDRLLFGSNYPEGINGSEIQMQNRVSSFKIGKRIAASETTLKGKTASLTLTLTFVDPYLEEIRFEESMDGGQSWRRIRSFYDHSGGGVYSTEWQPSKEALTKKEILVRIVGMNTLGGETKLGGPYRIHLN